MKSWRANRWRSQARTLWQRYRDVAELGDEHEVYTRLKEFLDSFRTQYQEVSAMGDNSETMDRLYGDCTEVLHSLLDYVHRELKLPAAADAPGGDGTSGAGAGAPAAAPQPMDPEAMRAAAEATRLSKLRVMELVPEALRAAELILRDKRYVQARWLPGRGSDAPPPAPPPDLSLMPRRSHALPLSRSAAARGTHPPRPPRPPCPPQAIKDSPATISRILSLLERLQATELH